MFYIIKNIEKYIKIVSVLRNQLKALFYKTIEEENIAEKAIKKI